MVDIPSENDCPICQGNTVLWRIKNEYSIYQCTACGYGFVHPFLSQDEIKGIYAQSGHGAKFTETSMEQVQEAERTYPNSTIDSVRLVDKIDQHQLADQKLALDIGAGYGFYTKELQERGYEVTPLELAANEKKILQELTGTLPISTTYEDFETDRAYGVVLMSQILEHAADPVQWTQKTHELLDEGGLWMIAVPHFNSLFRFIRQEKDFYIIPPEHLNYFTKKSLKILLENHEFELLEMETTSRLPWHKIPLPGIKYLGNPFLKLIDALGLGMMLNVIARKK